MLERAQQTGYGPATAAYPQNMAGGPDIFSYEEELIGYTPLTAPRLRTARRIFGLIPLLIFLLALPLFATQAGQSLYSFLQMLLRVIAVSLASSIVCIGAYGFYRYLLDRSHGL